MLQNSPQFGPIRSSTGPGGVFAGCNESSSGGQPGGAQRKGGCYINTNKTSDMEHPLYDLSNCELKPESAAIGGGRGGNSSINNTSKSPRKHGVAGGGHNNMRKNVVMSPQKMAHFSPNMLTGGTSLLSDSDSSMLSSPLINVEASRSRSRSNSKNISIGNVLEDDITTNTTASGGGGGGEEGGDDYSSHNPHNHAMNSKAKTKLVKPDDINIKSCFIESS